VALQKGVTTITWTAKDAAGNTETQVFTVTVADDDKPLITCNGGNIVQNTDAGVCSAIITVPTPTSSDNCAVTVRTWALSGATIASSPATGLNSLTNYTFNKGVTTINWTVKDAAGNSETCSQTVTVEDHENPKITTAANALDLIGSTDAGQCSKTYTLTQIGKPTATDNCHVASIVGVRSDNAALALDAPYSFGTTTITWTVTDDAANTSTYSQTININKITTTTNLTVTPTSKQYSDLVTFKATVTPASCGTTTLEGSTVTFKVGNQAIGTATINSAGEATLIAPLLEPTPFGALPVGELNPTTGTPIGQKVVTAAFTGYGTAYNTVPTATGNVTITQEDARLTFTGTSIVATTSSSVGTATVSLRATVQDISATLDAAGDTYNGDIRNARVRFMNGSTPISGWLTPTLVNSSDVKTGVVSFDWNVDIGTQTDVEYTVSMEVGGDGYYVRNSQDDNTVITVYKAVGDFITGGGYVIPIQTAGTYAADPGKRTNFGFNVKYNKSGKSLQGNMNFIFRRTVGGVVHTYQIKSNSMTSLGVNISNANAQTATFVSKCNLTDITNPLSPVSLGGNLNLQVNMTDRGEPGNNDDIAISLYNGSTLLYSSYWTGTNTAAMLLAGGNLIVHSGFSLGGNEQIVPKKNDLQLAPVTVPAKFDASAYPNPTTSQFNVKLESSNRQDEISIVVYSINGKVVEQRQHLAAGQTIQLGALYRPGVYIIEMIQGSQHKQLKLVKIPD
jgi:hypothetical protein